MGKTDNTMETRIQACLDAQDDHIRTISTQVETLHHTQECHYSTLQETQEKFKTMVLQWMKHLEKQPMTREENQSPTILQCYLILLHPVPIPIAQDNLPHQLSIPTLQDIPPHPCRLPMLQATTHRNLLDHFSFTMLSI